MYKVYKYIMNLIFETKNNNNLTFLKNEINYAKKGNNSTLGLKKWSKVSLFYISALSLF
jgi:hypothetical protein